MSSKAERQSIEAAPRPAEVVQELVSLIAAGIPAISAHQLVAEKLGTLERDAAKHFELVWRLATRLGGPAANALNRLTEVFLATEKAKQEVALAFAAPKATAKLVLGLPFVALGLAQALGMNPFGAIFGSVLGFISLALGLSLLIIGQLWSQRILARAAPKERDPGCLIDCTVIGLQAGLPLEQASVAAESQFSEVFNLEPEEQAQLAIMAAGQLSRNTGAALTQILTSVADRIRERERYDAANNIARLSIRLMIPLGVAVLPAFVLLSVVPIAISLLSSGQPI
jgi:tight adherence protein B